MAAAGVSVLLCFSRENIIIVYDSASAVLGWNAALESVSPVIVRQVERKRFFLMQQL